jgi:hypothetical protein
MNAFRLLVSFAFLGFISVPTFAGDNSPTDDPRLIGSWKYDNGLGTLFFHTSFSNGDFKRSIYSHGRLQEVAKGRWSCNGGVFHIIILKRATSPHPELLANVEQHIDQEIVEISSDSYVVHEASFRGDGLIKWIRIGGSDITQFKADEPNQSTDTTPVPAASPAGQGSGHP